MADHLLPKGATALEKATSESLDRISVLNPSIASSRGFKYASPIASAFAPWVVVEYGLGPISGYFDTTTALIAAGVPWQRVRGTPKAIADALAWIGYSSIALEDQNEFRRKWNRFQIGMGEVPADELPILMDAEYLVGLSDPARSVFFRGWDGYDVRAMEWSNHSWGNAIWGDDSGVRLDGGSVKWSHGESDTGSISAGETERQALGVDVSDGDELGWDDIPWNAPGVTWNQVTDAASFKSFLIRSLPVYVGFYDASGDPIGYRRPIAVRDVTDENSPDPGEAFIEFECRTGFGDGEGLVAASCSLVFRAFPTDTSKPGKLWLAPGEISFESGFNETDMTIGSVAVDFNFRRTVRQHVTLTLEI